MRKILCLALVVGTLGLAAACSSSGGNGGTNASDDSCGSCNGFDAGGDATQNHPDGGDAAVCVYPDDAGNDPQCPATYSTSYQGTLCPQAGLSCGYPGRGDGLANGCFATAALFCEARDSGLGGGPDAAIFDDAGPAAGYWTFAQ